MACQTSSLRSRTSSACWTSSTRYQWWFCFCAFSRDRLHSERYRSMMTRFGPSAGWAYRGKSRSAILCTVRNAGNSFGSLLSMPGGVGIFWYEMNLLLRSETRLEIMCGRHWVFREQWRKSPEFKWTRHMLLTIRTCHSLWGFVRSTPAVHAIRAFRTGDDRKSLSKWRQLGISWKKVSDCQSFSVCTTSEQNLYNPLSQYSIALKRWHDRTCCLIGQELIGAVIAVKTKHDRTEEGYESMRMQVLSTHNVNFFIQRVDSDVSK